MTLSFKIENICVEYIHEEYIESINSDVRSRELGQMTPLWIVIMRSKLWLKLLRTF